MTKKSNNKMRMPILLNYTLIVLAIIVNGLFVYALNGVTQFSSLSSNMFAMVNLGIIVFLVLMNLFIAFAVKNANKFLVYGVFAWLVVGLAGGAYIVNAVNIVNDSLGNIVQTGTVEETLEVSFVVHDAEGEFSITSLNQLEGRTVGVIANPEDQIGHILPIAELEAQDINADIIEYDFTLDIIFALFAGDIDAAALPSNYVAVYGGLDELKNANFDNTQAIHTFDEVVESQVQEGSDKDLTTEPFTVLLVGSEGTVGNQAGGSLSDALMVATVNPVSLKVTLTSIPRDSFVPVSCTNGEAKITEVRSSGINCTIGTVEDLLDIELDFYAEVNFEGIVDIVDALGGITVYNEFTFVGQSSSTVRGELTTWVPGADENDGNPWVLLNGEQALAFARERKAYVTGDFQRQDNQQQVIEAIITKLMQTRDINVFLDVIDAGGENFATNMTSNQMIGLFEHVLKQMSRTQVLAENVIELQGVSIAGYNTSKFYPSRDVKSVSIVRLFNGAISDAQAFIEQNSDLNRELDSSKTTKWSAEWELYVGEPVATWYSETQIPSDVPPEYRLEMPNFVGGDIGTAQTWAAENGIALSIVYVKTGDEGYDSTLPEGRVLTQSVAEGDTLYGVDQVVISVISHASDFPDFTGELLSVAQSWATTNGKTISVSYIQNGDAGYSSSYAEGTILLQNYTAGTDSSTFTKFTVSVVTHTPFVPYLNGAAENYAKAWGTLNGVTITIDEVAPGETGYDASLAEGTIVGQSTAGGTTPIPSSLTISVIRHSGTTSSSSSSSDSTSTTTTTTAAEVTTTTTTTAAEVTTTTTTTTTTTASTTTAAETSAETTAQSLAP